MSSILAGLVIGAHLATAHTAAGLEPVNPGIYARSEATGLTAGVFRNSYARTSVYFGYTAETDSKRFALTVGGVTGYPTERAVLPLVVPSVRFEASDDGSVWGKTAVRLSYLPKPPKYGRSHALHLSIERSF